MSRDVVAEIKRNYIQKLAELGKRVDHRKLDETRPISIEMGPIRTAEGSSRIKYGTTDLLIGIKFAPGEPFPDKPDSGVLNTNAELLPMASPDFETGPQRENAIELARVVDRGIRESKAIDMHRLCIIPGEKVWVLYLDIQVLDYDGNLFDSATLGSIAALSNCCVPASRFNLGNDFKLTLDHSPIACTVVKIGSALLVDPDMDEERVCSARITVTTDESGDIRAMQKGNVGHFRLSEVKEAVKLAVSTNQRIRGQFDFLQVFPPK